MEKLSREDLAQRIQRIESGATSAVPQDDAPSDGSCHPPSPVVRSLPGLDGGPPVATGWPDVDELFQSPPDALAKPRGDSRGGLLRGHLHEWFGLDEVRSGRAPVRSPRRSSSWTPPAALLVHLASEALAGVSNALADPGQVLWIGRAVWPYPHVLVGERGELLLRQSIFVDPPDAASRLWAVELALRCPSVNAVVADGRGLAMAETRRIQLAARSRALRPRVSSGGGGGSGTALAPLTLVARPSWERRELSAAAFRWRVSTAPSTGGPRFELELMRCKGRVGVEGAAEGKRGPGGGSVGANAVGRIWSLEWDGAKNRIDPFPVLVGRSSAAEDPSRTEDRGADVGRGTSGRILARSNPARRDVVRSADRRSAV